MQEGTDDLDLVLKNQSSGSKENNLGLGRWGRGKAAAEDLIGGHRHREGRDSQLWIGWGHRRRCRDEKGPRGHWVQDGTSH